MVTSAPWVARRMAMARPRPREPPVTTALFPLRSIIDRSPPRRGLPPGQRGRLPRTASGVAFQPALRTIPPGQRDQPPLSASHGGRRPAIRTIPPAQLGRPPWWPPADGPRWAPAPPGFDLPGPSPAVDGSPPPPGPPMPPAHAAPDRPSTAPPPPLR